MGLVMLDSGDRIFDENGGSLGYDYIRDDQVEWYAKQIGLLQGQYGADAKTLMFSIFRFRNIRRHGIPVHRSLAQSVRQYMCRRCTAASFQGHWN